MALDNPTGDMDHITPESVALVSQNFLVKINSCLDLQQ